MPPFCEGGGTEEETVCKTTHVTYYQAPWERGRIHDGTQYAKACFTMQEADVANVVHCPKRARQNGELYWCADELTKKRTLHVGNGLRY